MTSPEEVPASYREAAPGQYSTEEHLEAQRASLTDAEQAKAETDGDNPSKRTDTSHDGSGVTPRVGVTTDDPEPVSPDSDYEAV